MDTLVSLGSGVSFIYSVVLTFLIFFDIDAMHNAMNLHFESEIGRASCRERVSINV